MIIKSSIIKINQQTNITHQIISHKIHKRITQLIIMIKLTLSTCKDTVSCALFESDQI